MFIFLPHTCPFLFFQLYSLYNIIAQIVEKKLTNIEIENLLQQAKSIGEDILEMELINVDEAYLQLVESRKANRRKRLMSSIMKYAAMFSLPLLFTCIALAYMFFTQSDAPKTFAEIKALNGSIVKYELPDHSVVWLNSGSTLRYPTAFSSEHRQVELVGEAYFEVTADKQSPFYVNTSAGVSVYVYGTQFNVSAYEDSEYIETTLEKGKVNVILPNGKPEYELKPGEYVAYHKTSGETMKKMIDIDEKTAWKDGELIFRNASMEEIFSRLERHFNVDIVCHKHSKKDYLYRATFRDETLQQILDYLGKSATMKWKIENIETSSKNSKIQKRIIIDLY